MISVVTPTYRRPDEVAGLLHNLAAQTLLPQEVILVDGSDASEMATESVVNEAAPGLSFTVRYFRYSRGTAIQRNAGIDEASGDLIALIDDDVRLSPEFFKTIADVFEQDEAKNVGGVVGYRTNQHFTLNGSERWRWYRRLGLLKVFEPGRYDFKCGYPINNNMQPPFEGTREVDFMTTACAVWRRQVFDEGLRFDPFFRDYGVLEDAHFALRARRKWRLLQSGNAQCEELHSPNGRVDRRKIGYKSVVNYYYVFRDIASPLSVGQKFRFWRYQVFELFRVGISSARRQNIGDFMDVVGRLTGIVDIFRKRAFERNEP